MVESMASLRKRKARLEKQHRKIVGKLYKARLKNDKRKISKLQDQQAGILARLAALNARIRAFGG